MRLLGTALVIGALLAACGGGEGNGERVLQLGGGDITESQFRLDTRVVLADMATADEICTAIQGLSDGDAADLIVAAQHQQGIEPVQEAQPADQVRAAALVQEECERVQSAP